MKTILTLLLFISVSANALGDNESLAHLGAGAKFIALNDFEVPANTSELWLCQNAIKVDRCSIRERSIVDFDSQCALVITSSVETRKLVKGATLEVTKASKEGLMAQVEFKHSVIKNMNCWQTESSRYGSTSYPLTFGKVKALTKEIFQITEQEPKEIEAENICK